MKISKSIRAKIFVLVAFLVLMFVQVGPYILYADENELTFSYRKLSMIATNEYYNTNGLSFSEAYIGQNPAYCLDYGIPLPVSSGGTVKYIRQLSAITTAGLVYGYPNVSASSLGVNSNEEASIATQIAIWRLSQATGVNDSQKTNYILDMDNFRATTGNEAVLERVKAAAQRIINRALADPYYANPTINIVNANSKIKILDNNKMLVGPYKIDGRGYNITSVEVALVNAPESAVLCDANGNAKTNFANQEDVYVLLNQNVGPVTFTLRVDQKGNHNVGKVYGTGNPSDGKQDYCFLATLPDALTALMDISLPELTGGIKIIKIDQDNNKLAGVTFQLKDTEGNVLQTKNTDENGVIEFYNLKLGKYVVLETSSLEGYLMMDLPVETEVKYNTINDITIKNVKIKGGLKLIKVGEDRTTPVAGVTFQVLDSSKNVIDTITTNSEGVAISTNLAAGTYYFKEISAIPEAHVMIDSTEHEFTITDPNAMEVYTVMNYYTRGRLTIHKTTEDDKPIKGVIFDILDENQNVVDTITTDENGNATTSRKLKYGTYYYQEKSAPSEAHVVVDTTMKQFTMEYDDKTIEVKNDYQRGQLKIIKTDDNENKLSGVVFDILDENQNVVDTITTDKDGIAISKKLVVGKYYYQEKSCDNPKVIIDENIYEFNITFNNEIVTEEIQNEVKRMGRLKIFKTGDDGRVLENITFNILDSNKNIVDTITTNEEGIAISKYLDLGKYYYKELPSDNKLVIVDENEYEFNIINDEQVVEENVENELIRGNLSIFKIDENGNYLNGVTFTLLDENGNEVGREITTGEGVVRFENLLPGKYNFKEVEAPVYVVADEEEKAIEITVEELNVEVTVENKFAKGILKIHKTDMADNNLSGVTFEILDSEKNVVDTKITDENGIIESIKLPIGKYYYREVKAEDENIIIDTKLYSFNIAENEQIVTVEMKNKTVDGVIVITKVDSSNKNIVLSGAEMQILDSNKNIIATLTTDENGQVKLGNLKVGKYYYKETKAPTGYILDSNEYEFSITKDAQVKNITFKNEAKKLPQTGGFISTNMLIVIIVAVVSIVGYITISIVTKNKQNN